MILRYFVVLALECVLLFISFNWRCLLCADHSEQILRFSNKVYWFSLSHTAHFSNLYCRSFFFFTKFFSLYKHAHFVLSDDELMLQCARIKYAHISCLPICLPQAFNYAPIFRFLSFYGTKQWHGAATEWLFFFFPFHQMLQ